MSTWLKLLPLEIQEVNELIEPTEEVKEGETIAGVISDELKKIWTLCKSIKRSAELLEIEMRYSKPTDEERARVSELMAKGRALEVIFWIGAIDDLQLWGHSEQCALRVGWQVVEFKQPEMPFPFKLFGGQQ